MKYYIPFTLRGKENTVSVEYGAMASASESGFNALKLPFDPEMCVGYPMAHAYFENLNLNGYERHSAWIQIVKREEYNTIAGKEVVNVVYDLDGSNEMYEHKWPYFALGYPAELFDAPCNNLDGNEKLIWTAYAYLVDPPSRMNDFQLVFLAGFSWGYMENNKGEVEILNFKELSEKDWEEHRKYAEFEE